MGAAKQNATLVKLYLVLTCMYLVFAFVLAGVFIGTVDGEDIVPQYHSLSPSDKRAVDEAVSTAIVTVGVAFAVTVGELIYCRAECGYICEHSPPLLTFVEPRFHASVFLFLLFSLAALTLYFWMVVYSFYQELKEVGGSMA